MRKTILALSALTLALAACDMRAPLRVGYEAPKDSDIETDTTVYGFCGRLSTPTSLQIITSSDDTLTFDVSEARKQGKVFADYDRGEEIYVVPDATRRKALMTINKNMLLGTWVMPSPFDGSTPSGITLKEGGEAESFNQQGDIIYKSWRIINGKLEIVATHDDEAEIYDTTVYEIVKMTRDSLYIASSDDSYEYGRYQPEAPVDLGIQFEDIEDDDYNFF
mgnify:CR=1 FL=1